MDSWGENWVSCIIWMNQSRLLALKWYPKANIWFWIWQTHFDTQEEIFIGFHFPNNIGTKGEICCRKEISEMLTQTWDAYLNQIIWKITKKLNASKINSTKTNLFGNEITSYRWIRNVKPNCWILLALLSNKSRRKKCFFCDIYFVNCTLHFQCCCFFLYLTDKQFFLSPRVQQCCYHFLATLTSGRRDAQGQAGGVTARTCDHILWDNNIKVSCQHGQK